MKSRLESPPASDVFVSDADWRKLILDPGQLLGALREDDLASLVRDVLRPRYGDSPLFLALADDVTKRVLAKIADRLKDIPEIAVLFDEASMRRAEVKLKSRGELAQASCYWRGENG